MTTWKRCVPAIRLLWLFVLSAALSPAGAQHLAPPEQNAQDHSNIAPFPIGAPITRQQVLEMVRSRNPELVAMKAQLEAAQANKLQAGLRPNPELGAEIENFGAGRDFPGFRRSEITLGLSQLIETGGKRQRRVDLAEEEQQLLLQEIAVLEQELLADASELFFRVLAAGEQLELAEELVVIARSVEAAIERGVRAGSISTLEQSRAGVEVQRSLIAVSRFQLELRNLKTELALYWAGNSSKLGTLEGELQDLPIVPALATLRPRLDQHPQIARQRAEINRRQASVDLQQALSRADITLGAGLRYFNEADETAFVIGAQVPLQIFDRNQGGTQAARSQLHSGNLELKTTQIRMENQLALAHSEYEGAYAELQTLKETLLPQAEHTFNRAQQNYLRGNLSLSDVLDTERLLFELKAQAVDAQLRCHTAIARLESLSGTGIHNKNEASGRDNK